MSEPTYSLPEAREQAVKALRYFNRVLVEEHKAMVCVEHDGAIMFVVKAGETQEWFRRAAKRRGVKIGVAPPDFMVEIADEIEAA